MNREDHTGKRYWRLTAIAFVWMKGSDAVWLFKCDCGHFTFAAARDVKRGATKSCGCLQREWAAQIGPTLNLTHGRRYTTEYSSFYAMITRCTNPKAIGYRHYGGRGIKVCDRWNPARGGSFEDFFADMGPRPPGTTLDRNDNEDDYYKENCQWAEQQRANRRGRNTQSDTMSHPRSSRVPIGEKR
jgi:hypothetical protein